MLRYIPMITMLACAAPTSAQEAATGMCASLARAHWDTLSAGDKSVLRLSLEQEDAAVLTVEGSPFAPVYLALANAVYMAKLEEGMPPPILQYAWTESGREQCAVIRTWP